MRILGSLTLLLLTTTATHAASITSQDWNLFSTATGQITPVGADNSNGSPYISASSNAIVTSGGFLYSLAAPLVVDVFVPNFGLGADYLTDLTLTVGVSPNGMPLDPDSAVVTPLGGTALAASSTLANGSEWTFRWSLPSNAPSYLFRFSGGPHMALASVGVTTSAAPALASVPEPATFASLLVGLAGTGLMIARRRAKPVAA